MSVLMNVQEAIADFLHHGQAERNLSERTIRAYQSDLSQFHVHVDGAQMVDITSDHLEQYLDKLGTGPYRDTSIRRKVAALLAAPKDQIGALSGSRDHSAGGRNRYFCAIRDNVILELLFSTGIRIGELVALNVSDVGMENSQIHIIGRATRGRTVTITSHVVIDSLMNYLEMRSDRSLNTDALFVGRSGT